MILFFVDRRAGRPAARRFFTVRNSQNILVAITPVLLLGLGQTFVIISAGIDLSRRLGDEPRLGALGARHPRQLQCRRAAARSP